MNSRQVKCLWSTCGVTPAVIASYQSYRASLRSQAVGLQILSSSVDRVLEALEAAREP